MSTISKERQRHDLALLFVKKEMKKRCDSKTPWQKEIENMLDDYVRALEFMETCWNKHVPD